MNLERIEEILTSSWYFDVPLIVIDMNDFMLQSMFLQNWNLWIFFLL